MKLITLGKIAQSLEKMQPQVKVPKGIRVRAGAAIDRMLAVSSQAGESYARQDGINRL
jgi:quinolinate synthase